MTSLLRGALLVGMATASIACGGAATSGGGAKQPTGTLTVSHLQNPEDAPEEAKTVQVDYTFNHDLMNKDFTKTYRDGFDKHGVKVDQLVVAKSHFDVKDAKITGTVTYVKKGFAHYSIIEASLVATGHYDADVQVDVDVTAKGDTKKADKELGNTILGGKPIPIVKNMMPTNIPIAGPLFLHAHFDLTAACEMDASGQMHATTGVGVAGDVRLAAKYKKAGFDKGNGKKSKFAFEAKTPNFELSPKPYVRVEGKQQNVHGKCSLQPTTVLLMEKMVGAKLSIEPYVEVSAQRPSSKAKWQLDAQAGVSVNAATDIQFMGRRIGKPKEYTLFDIALTKKGDALADAPARAKAAPVAETLVEQAPTEVAANVAPENLPPSSDEEPAAGGNTAPAELKAPATTPALPARAEATPPIEANPVVVAEVKTETKTVVEVKPTPIADIKPAAEPKPAVAVVTKSTSKDDSAPNANADILNDALAPAPESDKTDESKKVARPGKKGVAKKQPAAGTAKPAIPKKKPAKKKDAA